MAENKASRSIAPLFMFGFERSGTTLLSMMLGAHPEIAVPLTVTGLWYRYSRRLHEYGLLGNARDVERLIDDLLREERILLWDVELDRDSVLDGLEPGDFGAVVQRFHCLYAQQKRKPYWGNLDIATLDDMDIAHGWFPDARFLHIVRDGRDVALSHETMPYGTSNTLGSAEHWKHRLQTNVKMGAILGPERYQVVRYEDLILDTDDTLRRICRFVGVAYSKDMLEYPAMVDEKVPVERRWLWPALDSPPDKSKVYRWKTEMSSTKRIVFERSAKNMLDEMGYETYDRLPRRALSHVYELWCFAGRGGRLRRLASKLGLRRSSQLERAWQGKSSAQTYESLQQNAFGGLVSSGVYDRGFEHGRALQDFFGECMSHVFEQIRTANGCSVLDCGCGPGAWLDFVCALDGPCREATLYGFDVTPEMVELARSRLRDRIPAENFRTGNIIDDGSYTFDNDNRRFQIIYAFDVVQQLPRSLQFEACLTMSRRLAPTGCAVIFDHDRWSRYGYRMGWRKLITKYLKLKLVPAYYCNARYPPLAKFASEIASTGKFATEIRVAPDGAKRALIIRSLYQ